MTFSQFMTNLKLRYLNKYHKVRYSDTTYKLQQVYPTGEDLLKFTSQIVLIILIEIINKIVRQN